MVIIATEGRARSKDTCCSLETKDFIIQGN